MCIRLLSANTESAMRTIENYKQVHQVSMSSAEKRSSWKDSANIRLEERLNGFKKVSDDE